MNKKWRRAWTVILLSGASILASRAGAQTTADFYRGKTVRVVIGYGPGGGYDIYGRLAAEFLGRHIPGNPTLLPVNMPGNSSLRAVDYLLNVAPRDGTYLGSVQQSIAMTALIDPTSKIDPSQLPYVGRVTSNIDVAVALQRTGIASFGDAKRREIVVGADQSGSMSVIYARTLNAYAGAKLKIVKGDSGSNEVQLAAERGEIEVNGAYSLPAVLFSHPDWVSNGAATLLYQNALKRFAKLPGVPTILELVDGEEGKAVARVVAGTAEIGRSIVATPGVPPDRLAALRTAFQDMLRDPDFLAACETRKLMLDPADGWDMDAINRETMAEPKAIVEALRAMSKE